MTSIDPSRIFCADAFKEILAAWSQELHRYSDSIPTRSVMQWATPTQLERLLGEASFEEGTDLESLLSLFREQVLSYSQHQYHGLAMGHQIGCPLPVAAVADLAASFLNQGMGIWEVAPGPVALTQQMVRWFLKQARFGSAADGILTSGGTEANLTAILAARARAFGPDVDQRGLRLEDRPVILASALSHYSISRAAAVAGMGRNCVTTVPVDTSFRMRANALAEAVAKARAAGETIVCVVASAGTTSLGTFDPLPEIADLCEESGLWLHVDGAHGASFLLTQRWQGLLAGIERATSLTWDPHKMLFMPSTLGLLLVAEGADLATVFDDRPEYLFGGCAEDAAEWNFTRKNLRCTQRFDALKVWAALKLHGRETIAALLNRTIELAQGLWERLDQAPWFQPLIPPPCNIVCFRCVPPDFTGTEEDLERLNAEIRTRLLRDGSAWLTSTTLKGRIYLRATFMNPTATESDLDHVVGLVRNAAERILEAR